MKEFIEGPHPILPILLKLKGITNPVILGDPAKKKANGFMDLTGRRFGKQVCVKWVGSEITQLPSKRKALWLVQCDCGVLKICRSSAIVKRKSCGCDGIAKTIEFNIRTKTKQSYSAFSDVWQAYRSGAKKRHYSFNISKELFREITAKNCNYCGAEPSMVRKFRGTKYKVPEFLFNGIDRVDNSIGYEPDNIVPCCSFCNKAKASLQVDIFISKIKQIYDHLNMS